MSKHSHIVIGIIALIFFIQGAFFLLSSLDSYGAGFRGWAVFSVFISFAISVLVENMIKHASKNF